MCCHFRIPREVKRINPSQRIKCLDALLDDVCSLKVLLWACIRVNSMSTGGPKKSDMTELEREKTKSALGGI